MTGLNTVLHVYHTCYSTFLAEIDTYFGMLNFYADVYFVYFSEYSEITSPSTELADSDTHDESENTIVQSVLATSASNKQPQIPSDLGKDKPAQPALNVYPTRLFGKRPRRFQASWYINRPWLEYSQSLDAAFCYACRMYGRAAVKDQEQAFVSVGYTNWKAALESGSGLLQHATAKVHLDAMQSWVEHASRTLSDNTVGQQLNAEQLVRNRYYIKRIAEVVQFLAVNELGFRGDSIATNDELEDAVSDDQNENGMFGHLFEFTMKNDSHLRTVANAMPKNAKYTSPEIQNEVIQLLASMVKEKIVTDCLESDIGMFCVKCDETRDRCNVENMSIVLRFVKQGVAYERLLSIINLKEVDAHGIMKAILKELRDSNLDPSKILSQCFDGAAVMSGAKGGVQKLLQLELQKVIPYIHCYNHQLHLVVVHSIEAQPKAKSYFAICQQLYIFLRRHYAAVIYEGQSLKRLLEQRWTGHLECSVAIKQNRDEIIETLEILAESGEVPADVSIEALGILGKVNKPEFALMTEIIVRLLTIMKPANAMLQSKTCNMGIALELVQSVITSYKELRNDESFAEFAKKAGLDQQEVPSVQRPKRATVKSKLFKDSVVMTEWHKND